jgi:hypothetical protein
MKGRPVAGGAGDPTRDGGAMRSHPIRARVMDLPMGGRRRRRNDRGRSVLLVVGLGVVVLQRRLLAGLGRVFRAGGDFLAAMLLFLLHFFVVRDIAWIGHGSQVAVAPIAAPSRRRLATAICPSPCQTDMIETDFVTR